MDSEVELTAFEPVNKKARESGAAEMPDAPTIQQTHRQEQFRQDKQQQQQQDKQQERKQQQEKPAAAAAAAAGGDGDVAMEEAPAAAERVEFTPGGWLWCTAGVLFGLNLACQSHRHTTRTILLGGGVLDASFDPIWCPPCLSLKPTGRTALHGRFECFTVLFISRW
jgi:hypothetical protein